MLYRVFTFSLCIVYFSFSSLFNFLFVVCSVFLLLVSFGALDLLHLLIEFTFVAPSLQQPTLVPCQPLLSMCIHALFPHLVIVVVTVCQFLCCQCSSPCLVPTFVVGDISNVSFPCIQLSYLVLSFVSSCFTRFALTPSLFLYFQFLPLFSVLLNLFCRSRYADRLSFMILHCNTSLFCVGLFNRDFQHAEFNYNVKPEDREINVLISLYCCIEIFLKWCLDLYTFGIVQQYCEISKICL